ncbi:hypothetical protein VD0002_g7087 [Verticillium dahliae]|uniref:Uncharacterized protein n=1 Tax=Verticillium dahliae TaxID=27337 RepID=A0AA45AMM0_VERDA|nr:hypothetical protein BJF96_g4536 [Verticillium dahliae]PNH48665.1 hypothetical protein VD0003_g8469 [Verticillium dahliae]PNH60568.1 hypothetical protein VD0002_g7087 [Verticillium dahliae]
MFACFALKSLGKALRCSLAACADDGRQTIDAPRLKPMA